MIRLSITDTALLSTAIDVLNREGIVVYPTDTLYGFGVDATSGSAIARLNRLKNRSGPMSVIAPDLKTARNWTRCTDSEWEQIVQILGGATTVIASGNPTIVHPNILGQNQSLGIRMPDQPIILKLVEVFQKPITSTSVNRSGSQPLNNPLDIVAEFENDIDLFIDAGILPPSSGSTIYFLTKDGLEQIR